MKMVVRNNVISIDSPTWYCMRQCNESIRYLSKLNNPIYQVEINGEKDILRHFMREVLTQKEAA